MNQKRKTVDNLTSPLIRGNIFVRTSSNNDAGQKRAYWFFSVLQNLEFFLPQNFSGTKQRDVSFIFELRTTLTSVDCKMKRTKMEAIFLTLSIAMFKLTFKYSASTPELCFFGEVKRATCSGVKLSDTATPSSFMAPICSCAMPARFRTRASFLCFRFCFRSCRSIFFALWSNCYQQQELDLKFQMEIKSERFGFFSSWALLSLSLQ